MIFVSNNLRLTKLLRTDAADITEYMQDKEIYDNTLRIPYPYKLEHAETWIEDCLIYEEEEGINRNFAIRNDAGKIMGMIGLHFNYGKTADKSEFGYWLAKKFWNKGLATEVVKKFCEVAKEQYKMKTLEAHVFAPNVASQKVLAKAGFAQVGFMPNYHTKDGKKIDAIKFVKQL